MKLATAVTLDGLIRALRWTTHDLAEAAERGHAAQLANEKPTRRLPHRTREKDDDRVGR